MYMKFHIFICRDEIYLKNRVEKKCVEKCLDDALRYIIADYRKGPVII